MLFGFPVFALEFCASRCSDCYDNYDDFAFFAKFYHIFITVKKAREKYVIASWTAITNPALTS